MTSEQNIIDSIEKYTKALANTQAFGWRTVYRGQSSDWSLVPRLYRYEYIPEAAGNLRNLEEELLRDFENQARPLLQSTPQSKLEWIALAQHFGLPTRLLDWTQNPLAALFFAVDDANESSSNQDGVVWILSTYSIPRVDYSTLSEIDQIVPNSLLYFPPHISPRITAQQGCFTLHQLPDRVFGFVPPELEELNGTYSRTWRKLLIPAEKKQFLRSELDKLGINYFTIYPDLAGLCRKLEWKMQNHSGYKIKSTETATERDVFSIPNELWNPRTRKEVGEGD